MTLLDLLDKNLMKVPLLSSNKLDLIDELLNIYKEASGSDENSISSIRKAVLDREMQGSTAMENGIAIPHAKISGLKKAAVVVGVSRLGIDFGGDEKCKVFFLVIAPGDKPSEHIQLLASIAKLCTSPMLSRLMQGAKSKEELYQLLMD